MLQTDERLIKAGTSYINLYLQKNDFKNIFCKCDSGHQPVLRMLTSLIPSK